MTKYKPVKIPSLDPGDNKFTDENKNVWRVTTLIHKSKDLEPFEIPLSGMDLRQRVFEDVEPTAIMIAKHMKRANETNLDYPIILDEDGVIMDGWHRVIKALILELPTIKAVRFDQTPAPDYTKAD